MSPIEPIDTSATAMIEAMQRFFARSTDGIALLNLEGRIVAWNDALERLLRTDGASLRGCHAGDLGKSETAALHDWLHAASTEEHALWLPGVDGGRRTAASASVSRIDGIAGHRLLRLRDASRERQAEFRLQRFLRTVDASDSALAILRPNGSIVGVSGGFTRLFGHALADVIGRTLHEVLAATGSEDDATPLRYPPQDPAPDRGAWAPQFAALVQTLDGQRLWISAVISPVLGDDGHVTRLAAVLTDVTSTKMREVLQYKALEAMARDRPLQELASLVCGELERVAPEVRVAIYDFDEDGRPKVLAAPGLPAAYANAVAAFVSARQCGGRRRALGLDEPTALADLAGDPRCAAFAATALAMDVKAFWSRPIVASDGRVAGALAFHYREPRAPAGFHLRLAEISLHPLVLAFERERTRARLHRLSNYDTLTGLPNRMMLRTQVARMLVDAERTDSPLAVLVFDVDRFKRVNDTQGPGAGDELLCEIARRLAAGVRGGDFLARPAADEFVAVLPQCGAKQAAAMAERMLDLVRRPAVAGTMTFNPAATVGIAVFPDDGRDADALIGCADFAMHQAKGVARGGVRFFRSEMNASMRERVTMELALREALAKNELSLHYQPQVIDGEANVLHGVEALLRWRHAELGDVSPALFVPLAEECGLIDELSAWVLDEACRQMAQWRRRSVEVPRVAVNVSASSFADPHLARRVAAALGRHALVPSDLTLEITEQVMIDGSDGTAASISAVRALGVQLSLDDFGTGYSSLGHLHRLPFDEIKLDRSFVRDLAASASARALTTTVLRIGESLGMTVVAEGVETPAQLAFLAERGCPVVQGYLFARPMCAADLERWMERRVGPPPPLSKVAR